MCRWLTMMLFFAVPLAQAGDGSTEKPVDKPLPKIAIIIDDIGDRPLEGRQAVNLPGPIACAFLPHTPYASELAHEAHRNQKTVMLHLPLQATNGKALGPGAIELDTTEKSFRRILSSDLASIPFVEGVNNHMGSLLTRHPGHMAWLMSELRERKNLFFVDSYTHKDSVALQLAEENDLPSAKRDVFLDNIQTQAAIESEFQRLVALAKENGHAVGIGHPYSETMKFLAEHLPDIEARYGVNLVPITALLHRPVPVPPAQAGISVPD